MSFFDKIIHSVKGLANDTLDKHQDLGANARQNIRDLDTQLQEADEALLNVRAEAELLKGKKEKAQAEVDKWLNAAKNAAGKDDGLARECLQKKATAKTALDTVEATIAKFAPTVKALEEHIEQLRADYGTTILLTTHFMEEADNLCHRVAILYRGKVVIAGAPADLKASVNGGNATLDDVFIHYTGGQLEQGGDYRETARTRRTAHRLR